MAALVGLAAVVATACNRRSDAASVVVYCSADKEFAEPVFRAYEAKTGVKILPLYDTEETKTAGLTARPCGRISVRLIRSTSLAKPSG